MQSCLCTICIIWLVNSFDTSWMLFCRCMLWVTNTHIEWRLLAISGGRLHLRSDTDVTRPALRVIDQSHSSIQPKGIFPSFPLPVNICFSSTTQTSTQASMGESYIHHHYSPISRLKHNEWRGLIFHNCHLCVLQKNKSSKIKPWNR